MKEMPARGPYRPRRILDDPHAYVALLDRTPARDAGFTWVLSGSDLRPVADLDRDMLDLHAGIVQRTPALSQWTDVASCLPYERRPP